MHPCPPACPAFISVYAPIDTSLRARRILPQRPSPTPGFIDNISDHVVGQPPICSPLRHPTTLSSLLHALLVECCDVHGPTQSMPCMAPDHTPSAL